MWTCGYVLLARKEFAAGQIASCERFRPKGKQDVDLIYALQQVVSLILCRIETTYDQQVTE